MDFECLLDLCWLSASLIHRLVFHFVVKPYIRRSLSFLPKLYIRGGRQGQAFALLKLQRKSHHQPPSFCAWTTLYCSPSGQCWLMPQLYAGLHSPWERRQRETESEWRRMESMNLQRKHNWDTKLGLTCTSWTADWTLWHRYNFFLVFLGYFWN